MAQPGRAVLGLGGDDHVVGPELAHRLVQRDQRPVVADLARRRSAPVRAASRASARAVPRRSGRRPPRRTPRPPARRRRCRPGSPARRRSTPPPRCRRSGAARRAARRPPSSGWPAPGSAAPGRVGRQLLGRHRAAPPPGDRVEHQHHAPGQQAEQQLRAGVARRRPSATSTATMPAVARMVRTGKNHIFTGSSVRRACAGAARTARSRSAGRRTG